MLKELSTHNYAMLFSDWLFQNFSQSECLKQANILYWIGPEIQI